MSGTDQTTPSGLVARARRRTGPQSTAPRTQKRRPTGGGVALAYGLADTTPGISCEHVHSLNQWANPGPLSVPDGEQARPIYDSIDLLAQPRSGACQLQHVVLVPLGRCTRPLKEVIGGGISGTGSAAQHLQC